MPVEIWVMGQHYLSLAWAQEITARSSEILLSGNVVDASVLLSPSLSLSVSDEVQLVAGGFVAGRAAGDNIWTEVLINPDALHVNPEFGLMPGSAFVLLRSYF